MFTTKQKAGITIGIMASLLPIWRSGGRNNMTFWGWLWNHTIFGPRVEYVPEEDYEAEICSSFRRS